MATNLITKFPIFVFSSQLREIEFSTDLDKLVVAIEDGSTEFFRTTLYAFNGSVTLINVAEVIESYMIRNDRVFTAFTLYYYSADGTYLGSFNLNTLYCSHIIEAEAGVFASSNFLTTLTAKRVPKDSVETLSFLHGQEDASLKIHAVYETEDGTVGSKSFTLRIITTDDIGVSSIQVNYVSIFLRLRLHGIVVGKVLSYTVEFNGRFFTYYVVDSMPEVSFTFRNCFNVVETAYFNSVTTTKTKVNRSLALSQGRYSFYDQSEEKTYEVESAPLTQAEAEWVEQMFISHSVRHGVTSDVTTLPEVIITESTCEIADKDTELNKVKFTWQFADKRPHLPAVSTSAEIFTEPFNPTFT